MNIFLYSFVLRNIKNYIHRRYVPRWFHWLTEEFNLYSLVLQLYSSVLTDECFIVSCSARKNRNFSSKNVTTIWLAHKQYIKQLNGFGALSAKLNIKYSTGYYCKPIHFTGAVHHAIKRRISGISFTGAHLQNNVGFTYWHHCTNMAKTWYSNKIY
jgi:hypothetical protein